jgi:hypothetical protein
MRKREKKRKKEKKKNHILSEDYTTRQELIASKEYSEDPSIGWMIIGKRWRSHSWN